MSASTFTNNPALFGLELRLGTQLDRFDQPCELTWDEENDTFWLEFESEEALRRHLA